jgi:hypothetical protein
MRDVTFLGCTVVSTITRDSSDGLIAFGSGGNRQALLEQRLQPFLAHPVAPARQRGAIEHQPMLEELLAAAAKCEEMMKRSFRRFPNLVCGPAWLRPMSRGR